MSYLIGVQGTLSQNEFPVKLEIYELEKTLDHALILQLQNNSAYLKRMMNKRVSVMYCHRHGACHERHAIISQERYLI